MSIQVQGAESVGRALVNLAISFSGPKTRLRIAQAGAPVVVTAMRAASPMYNRPYHTFKRKDGKVVKVMAGNLKLSTQALAKRRKKIRDAGVEIVGPRYGRSTASVVGGTEATAVANYAHMIYGSARAFGQKVTNKAERAATSPAASAMANEVTKVLRELKAKYQFQ